MPSETHLLNEAYNKVRKPKVLKETISNDTVQVPLDEDELNWIINALVVHGSNPKFPGRKTAGPLMDKLKRHLFYTRTPGASDADLEDRWPGNPGIATDEPGYQGRNPDGSLIRRPNHRAI